MLETPSAQNPFPTPTGGCFNLGGTLAPFGAAGVESCPPVKPGTKIFVAANAVECSTFERNGTTETELRACVQDANLPGGELVKPAVEVDRKVVPVTDVETPLLNIDLPADNILGPPPVPAGPGLSVGRGAPTPADARAA